MHQPVTHFIKMDSTSHMYRFLMLKFQNSMGGHNIGKTLSVHLDIIIIVLFKLLQMTILDMEIPVGSQN